jgi:hypothetical protein
MDFKIPSTTRRLFMRLPWRREARYIETPCTANPRLIELETAKEILAEIFRVREADVEEMIHSRMEERCGAVEPEKGLWPATFCLGE